MSRLEHLRREPYKLFFPLGVLLAWAGLFHWILFATGRSLEFRSVFHSIAQIQGFMMCFGVGFLLTAIPRRTGTEPPSTAMLVVGSAAPVATTIAAYYERFDVSQMPWLVLVLMLIGFAVRRFRSSTAKRRPPNSFVWVPIAFLMGFAGIVLFSLYGALGLSRSVHDLAQVLVLQGIFLGLVLGVGGMVIPLITCGDAPPDADTGNTRAKILHLCAAALLVGTFFIETYDEPRAAYALRGAIVLAVLLAQSKIYRLPRRTGAHRWLVWLSAWAIPIGYTLAAIVPSSPQPGLHTVFIAGFGLMALAVGLHVSLAHGGHDQLVFGHPWQVYVMGACVVAACAMRALVSLDPANLQTWLGWASGTFLVGTIAWVWLALRAFRPAPRE